MKLCTRDDLIENVRYGRMTPVEAEAEASRLSVGPLVMNPPPQEFDPMAESWWTLPMAVAWITWRDPLEIVNWYDPYRMQCWFWQYEEWRIGLNGPVHKGHLLKQQRRATLSLLSLSESYDSASDSMRKSTRKVQEATALLWKALEANRLQGTGIPSEGGSRKAISDYEWCDLTPIEERGRDVVRCGCTSSRGYDEVSFRKASIFTLWPEIQSPTDQPELPATITPDGPGYFPLYCAAQWIATKAGALIFDPSDVSIWELAYTELMARIASGQVTVTGVRKSIREKIDPIIFASLRVDYPFSDISFELILSEELYLCSHPYIDDEHWQKGFDDSLQTRIGIQWSKLMVLKSDIAQFWQFSEGKLASSEAANFRTGAPGRPTPMYLVVAEHSRRLNNRETVTSISAEAKHLAKWLKQSHPSVPPLTPKTIENKIRAAHRRAKESPK